MKMFLTRLGPGSKAVITGDVTQVDLSDPEDSGLKRIQPILAEVADVEFVYFGREDVVRHRLVRDIILAFERHAEEESTKRPVGAPAPANPPAPASPSATPGPPAE
jgi:phosphate starvation-inducible PhoH-like protein